MFAITPGQVAVWTQVQRLATAAIAPPQRLDTAVAERRRGKGARQAEGGGKGSGKQAGKRKKISHSTADHTPSDLAPLDRALLAFVIELLQHRLPEREFDSAIVSFAAVLAWDAVAQAWKLMSSYSSLLSHLVYDCQLIALQHCAYDASVSQPPRDLTASLVAFRDSWLLNDTPGPVGWLLGTRLLAMDIANSTVEAAQLRWEADDTVVVYKDIRLPMLAISGLLRHELAVATDIFARELCFGLGGEAPAYRLSDIANNWDTRSSGASFLTDARNTALFERGRTWLFDQMRHRAALAEQMLC
jgi:hypothetical protein